MSFNPLSFMSEANQKFLKHKGDLRYGQFLMNYLKENHPDVIVPQEVDCFYDNQKIVEFIQYLMKKYK